MPRFFTTDIMKGTVRILGDDARHMARSLRMRAGGLFEACDLNGFDYQCEITEISPDCVVARVLQKTPSKSEPRVRISLFQALPKSDKLEHIAQKAVELGVYEITPVETAHCVARWDNRDAEKKLERLKKIVLEAAKQSGRGRIPQVLPLCGFEAAVEKMARGGLPLFFYEHAKAPLQEILKDQALLNGGETGSRASTDGNTVSVMIGSEGGFSPEEARYAALKGLRTARMGPRILRCETAPVCAISAILYAMGEF